MRIKNLGRTGLKVSELCLGCMTFGKEADEETSILRAAGAEEEPRRLTKGLLDVGRRA